MHAPTGKVTIVFTDVQGSTALWERVPQAMAQGLQLHDALLRALIGRFRGYEVKTEGDAFEVAFADPEDAVGWCLAAQEELMGLSWPDALLRQPEAGEGQGFRGLRVRMGAYLGEPICRPDPTTGRMDYLGPVANRATAVGDAGHGGQIVLTQALFDAVQVPCGHRDLGEHSFAELSGSERLVEVFAQGSQRAFPPLRTLDPTKTNLRPAATPFVGRDQDVERLDGLFDEGCRLVTLLGPGGTGKTRLAAHFGGRRLHGLRRRGGVWFCELASARRLSGVLSGVAAGLSLALAGAGDPQAQADLLGQAIAGRAEVLIILDNFEQVVDCALPTLCLWLEQAPQARFLVTSRQPLGLAQERVCELEPLPAEEARALFLERAASAKKGFRLGPGDSEAVDEIVRRLDGIPLAIELAAARVGVLPPKGLSQRLDRRFALLRGKDRSREARQATLRGTIDWSWELLQPWERAALSQCSVFVGGFGAEAVDAVVDLGDWPEASVAGAVVASLRDKSLLASVGSGGEVRYRNYETVREYAGEQLADPAAVLGPAGRPVTGPGPSEQTRLRHARWCAGFGSDEARERLRVDPVAARRLGREVDNLEAAAAWACASAHGVEAVACALAAHEVLRRIGPLSRDADLLGSISGMPGLTELQRLRIQAALGQALLLAGAAGAEESLQEALRLALDRGDGEQAAQCRTDLADLAYRRTRLDRAEEFLQQALRGPPNSGARARALVIAANVAWDRGQTARARTLYEQAMHDPGADADGRLRARANHAALLMDTGDYDAAERAFEAALAMADALDERVLRAQLLCNSSIVHLERGHFDRARAGLEQALQTTAEVGNVRLRGIVLSNLSSVFADQGYADEAEATYCRALEVHVATGNLHSQGIAWLGLASLAARRGDLDRARERLDRAQGILGEAAERWDEGAVLAMRGELALLSGEPGPALELFEQAVAILREVGDRLELGMVLCQVGHARLAQGGSADACLEEACSIRDALGSGPASRLGQACAGLARSLG